MTNDFDQIGPDCQAWAQYDDTSVLLCVRARPDGPIAPIRLSPDQVLGLVLGFAKATDAFNAHRKLVADAEDALADAEGEEER